MKPYPRELLEKFYRTMVRIRLCEESLVEPILNGEIRCPVHLYSGEEAVATGVCSVLSPDDYVFGTHRSHGHYLAKGGGVKELIAEIYGKVDGCSRGRGGSMHLIEPPIGMMGATPIVAGTIALAVGAGLASKIRGERRVSVSFFGDGAAGEGVLYESMNFAALRRLPILFVCENNFYSTHLPIRACRPNDRIYRIGKPYGIVSIRVDGNDVLKVYEAARRSVDLCRRAEGPVFMECVTYRLRGHVGPDDNIQGVHTDIRPAHEIKRWKRKDPIKRLEKHILENRILSEKEMESIRRSAGTEIAEAHVFARQSPYPEADEVGEYVFRE